MKKRFNEKKNFNILRSNRRENRHENQRENRRLNLRSAWRLALSALLIASLFGAAACSSGGGATVDAGADKIVTAGGGDPQNYGAEFVLYSTLGKLSSLNTFEEVCVGKTHAKKGVINYVQNISSRNVKNGDEFYFESDSTSALVTSMHRAFEKNGKVAFIDGNRGDIICSDSENYKNVYGVLPSKLLCGLVLNESTVVSGKLDKQASRAGASVYVYEVDKVSGTPLCALQSREFGGLTALPEYTENPILTLTVGSDFLPLSLKITQKYDISVAVLGKMFCEQELNCEFSKFNEAVEIPYAEEYNEALGSVPTVINPITGKPADENLQAVTNAALASDINGGVLFSGEAVYNEVKIPLKIHIKADLNAFLNGTATANSFEAALSVLPSTGALEAFYKDGKIYVNVAGTKYYFPSSLLNGSAGGAAGSAGSAAGSEGGAAGSSAGGASGSSSALGDALDLLSYFKIEKSAQDDRVYTLTLTSEASSLITAALRQGGVLGEGEDFSAVIELYVAGGRIGTASARLVLGKNVAALELAVSDKRLVLPSDLGEYAAFGRRDYAVSASAFGFDLSGTAAVSFDPLAKNGCVEFYSRLKIVNQKVSVYEFLNLLGVNAGDKLCADDDIDGLEFVIENGKAYALLYSGSRFVCGGEVSGFGDFVNNLQLEELIKNPQFTELCGFGEKLEGVTFDYVEAENCDFGELTFKISVSNRGDFGGEDGEDTDGGEDCGGNPDGEKIVTDVFAFVLKGLPRSEGSAIPQESKNILQTLRYKND